MLSVREHGCPDEQNQTSPKYLDLAFHELRLDPNRGDVSWRIKLSPNRAPTDSIKKKITLNHCEMFTKIFS